MNGQNDVVHIYSGILFSHKKEWMNLEIIILSDVSQKEKDKYTDLSISLIDK